MWDCLKCGTGRIAASLTVCPHCRAPRNAEPVAEAVSEPVEPAAEPVADEPSKVSVVGVGAVQPVPAPPTPAPKGA